MPFAFRALLLTYWLLLLYRLQEETAKVEEHLLDGSFTNAIIKCFTTSKANAFENLLEPLQKLLRLSPPVALSLAHAELFRRILQKLQSNKAVVRLNLLRIIRSICDASDEQGGLISQYGLIDAIQRLAEVDGAVLVRNMAGELIRSSEENDKLGISGSSSKRRMVRRASSATTPPSLIHSQSMPPTPTSSRSSQSTNYFGDRENRQRNAINGATPFRPTSRDGRGSNGTPGFIDGSGSAVKSRLPRTTTGRFSRQSMLPSSRKEENITPTTARDGTTPLMAMPNSRRRRQVNVDARWS